MNAHAQENTLEIALERWAKVLSHDSLNEMALFYSASNCITLKRLESSEEFIVRLEGLQSLDRRYRVPALKAMQATQTMNYSEAIHQWARAVEAGYEAKRGQQRMALGYLALARDHLKRGDTVRARENIQNAAQGGENRLHGVMLERVNVLEARCLIKERKWPEAIECLKESEHYVQLKEQGLSLLLKCYIQTSNLTKVENLLKHIKSRNHPHEYLAVAREYFSIGDTALARQYIKYALGDNLEKTSRKFQERAAVLEARCLLLENNRAEAIRCLSNAEEFSYFREVALRLLFKCYIYLSNLKNAEYICNLLDSEDSDDRHRLRGQLLFRQMNYQEAKEVFHSASQCQDSGNSSVWLIKTLLVLNEQEKADSQAREVEQLYPEDYVLQGRCWESAGKLLLAEERFLLGVEKTANTHSYKGLIRFYHNQRYWGKAHYHIKNANKAGLGSESMDAKKAQIEGAYESIHGGKSKTEPATIPLEFLSTESMISAIVERILGKNKTTLSPDKNSKKVAIVISSLGPGGAERQAVNLANGLLRSSDKSEVVMMCTHLSRKVQDMFYAPLLLPEIETIEYYKRDQNVSEEKIPELSDYWDLIKNIQPSTRKATILHMARAFIENEPDVVHAWLDETFINAALVCGMLGIDNVVGRWGSMPAGVNRTVTERSLHNIGYLEYAYKEISRLPGLKYTSNSRLTGDAYAQMMSIEKDKVEIVYNGIDADNLTACPDEVHRIRRSNGIPDTALVVGTVIRLSEEKRPELWLQVASSVSKAHPDVHFVVVGAGPLESRIAEIASTMNFNIHLVGKQDNVGVWYQLFDVLLLTSRVEGVSNVVIEAQWCGVPVVVPNVGGLSEAVLHEETGYLLEDDSVEEFTQVVSTLLHDKPLREKMGGSAASYAQEKFSSDKMVEQYQCIYGLHRSSA